MKMYVPEISDEIRLLADWTFELYNEDRNATLMEKVGDPRDVKGNRSPDYGSVPCTIPAGAVLKIDRVYIRKGIKDYSSITFLWKGEALPGRTGQYTKWDPVKKMDIPDGTYKIPRMPIRFWAKLDVVNNIEFERA